MRPLQCLFGIKPLRRWGYDLFMLTHTHIIITLHMYTNNVIRIMPVRLYILCGEKRKTDLIVFFSNINDGDEFTNGL